MSDMPLLFLKNLSKIFHTDEIETHALRNVSLQINRGDFLAITGPSGGGKSTLLSILGLLDTPSSGSYLLQGRPLENLDRSERARIRNRHIGFIFQSFNLISDLSVVRNVALPLTYRDDLDKREIKHRVEAALAKVDMSHRLQHYPAQLSGGQQQRVAVARALVSQPDIILADEPTGNLDSENADIVLDLLSGLHAEGATVCMVTHDAKSARRAQRAIHLFDGQIVDGRIPDDGKLASGEHIAATEASL